jgi:hypothetical protein
MFADLASPGTIENLATNPHVEINVDPILRKGYRFKGTAAVYMSGQMFDHGLEILQSRGSTACCRALKLATTPSLSMHMWNDEFVAMTTGWSQR